MGDPVSVHARTGRLAHERIEVEDTAVATVEFASGAFGVVHATTAAYPGVESRLSVFAGRGSAVIVDDALVYLHAAVGCADQGGADPESLNEVTRARRPTETVVGRGLGHAHGLQLRDLVRVVRARQAGDLQVRPRVGTEEGRRALALVLAMYESARTGRSVRL
jgi:predicted dehydrogenase